MLVCVAKQTYHSSKSHSWLVEPKTLRRDWERKYLMCVRAFFCVCACFTFDLATFVLPYLKKKKNFYYVFIFSPFLCPPFAIPFCSLHIKDDGCLFWKSHYRRDNISGTWIARPTLCLEFSYVQQQWIGSSWRETCFYGCVSSSATETSTEQKFCPTGVGADEDQALCALYY